MTVRVTLDLNQSVFAKTATPSRLDPEIINYQVKLRDDVSDWCRKNLTHAVTCDTYFRSIYQPRAGVPYDAPRNPHPDFAAILGAYSVRMMFGSDYDRRLFFDKWFS
jgi:hypothetical protein